MAADSSDSDNPLQSSTTDVDDEEDENYQPPSPQLIESDEDMPPAPKKMKGKGSTLLHFYKGTTAGTKLT